MKDGILYSNIWNLDEQHWCKIDLEKEYESNHRYHIVGSYNLFPEINPRRSATIRVHLLISNYFCDKQDIENFAEFFEIPFEHAQLVFDTHHKHFHDENKTNYENNRADNLQLNKIAARWPARAVAQFYFTDN